MRIQAILVAGVLLLGAPAYAVDRYISPTGNNANTCTQAQNPATPKLTLASVKSCMAAGDTTYIASGDYTGNFDITGLAGSDTNRFRFIGTGATAPRFLAVSTATSCRSLVSSSTTNGVWIENIKFDASSSGCPNNLELVGNRVENASNVTFKNVEFYYFPANTYITGSTNIVFEGGSTHDAQSDCVVGRRHYGFYVQKNTTNIVVQDHEIYNMPGGGVQVYPGPANGVTIRRNRIHHNSWCTSTPQGGITVFRDTSTSGPITNVKIYDNLIYKQADPTGGTGHGIRVGGDITGVEAYHNTVIGNQNNSSSGAAAYGIMTTTAACATGTCSPTGFVVKNNLVLGNEGGQINTAIGSGHDVSDNITTGTTADYFVDAANDDYRLKQGTNAARNAGVSVGTRPAPVGSGSDVGAYEQGEIASAVVNDGIDFNVSVMTPGIAPTTGITGVTIQCVGCTGSPTAVSVAVKPGSPTTAHVVVTGIVTPGTCTISIGTTNMVDSGPIGGLAQGVNSVTAFAVTGTCINSGGLGIPSGAIAYYKLNEGSGSIAQDETVNNFDALASPAVTWPTVYVGSGMRFPNDGQFHNLVMPFGASTNMATASGATCAIVKADPLLSQKVVFSSGSNGANQRLYYGWATVAGQVQWGIGIQDSGLTTGSEFPVTAELTSVCLSWEGGTAYLWVNGVKGAQSGKSVKTYGSYVTTATNFQFGNDGTFLSNSGGFDVDEIVFWNPKPADAVLQAYHTDRFISGAADACYAEANHQAQLIGLHNGSPVNYGTIGGAVDVVAGGSLAVIYQIDCVGVNGGSIAVMPFYSLSLGGAFALPVPVTMGPDGVSIFSVFTVETAYLNAGSVFGNLSGGLTNVPGTTIYASGISPEISLLQNQSKVLRYLFTFGDIPGQVRCIALKQGGGLALAGGVTPAEGACARIVPKAVGVP